MKFGEKLLFMCAIVAGYIIFMFVIMWAVFGFSLYWQIQNGDLTSPYTSGEYRTDGEVIDFLGIINEEK